MTATYSNTCLITRQVDEKQLILVTAQQHLPNIETKPHYWQDCELVNQAIRQTFDIDVLTVRCLTVDFSREQRHYVYTMVYRGGDLQNGQWVTVEQLSSDAQVYLQMSQNNHPNPPAWYTPYGYQMVYETFPRANIDQVRTWERSSIWRIREGGQTRYLKMLPIMFDYEFKLTQWLAQRFPEHVPMPQSPFASAMLSPEYRGAMLSQSVDVTCRVLEQYAELQVATLNETATLAQLGVLRRDMNWVRQYAQQLLSDDAALRVGSNPLTDDEIQKLREIVPQLDSDFETLQGVEALEHGDLHHGQIFVDGKQVTFTDFSDATLTHPFFSLVYFLWDVQDEDDAHQRITSAYLQPFLQAWSPAQCKKMMASARHVSGLYSAVRYYADILPQMVYKWEMENMLAFNLRILLAAIE